MGFMQARVNDWSLSTLPSPIFELQHAPLPFKVLWVREHALTPPFSVVFYFDSHLSLSKSWECVTNHNYGIISTSLFSTTLFIFVTTEYPAMCFYFFDIPCVCFNVTSSLCLGSLHDLSICACKILHVTR